MPDCGDGHCSAVVPFGITNESVEFIITEVAVFKDKLELVVIILLVKLTSDSFTIPVPLARSSKFELLTNVSIKLSSILILFKPIN
jgi:hypothetical protein